MATSLLLHWHQNTPLRDPQSQKPQRASNQSDKTELSQSVCIQTQNRLPVCLSVCLPVGLTVCLFISLPLCPFHVSLSFFFLSILLFFFFYICPSFLVSLLPYLLSSSHPSFLHTSLFCLSFVQFSPSSAFPLFFPYILPVWPDFYSLQSFLLFALPLLHLSFHLSIFLLYPKNLFISSILFLSFLHFFQSSFLSLVFPLFLLSFFLHIFLLLVLFYHLPHPPHLSLIPPSSCVSWSGHSSVLCTHCAPRGFSLMCCCCLDSVETIRSVLNAASHWAPLWLVCQHRLDFNCLLKCDSVCCAVHSNPTEISWIGESKLIRFEQAVQIQPVLTDTPISRGTEWESVFFTFCPFKYVWQVFILFLCLATFFIYCSLNRKKMFSSVSKKQKPHITCRWEKRMIWSCS